MLPTDPKTPSSVGRRALQAFGWIGARTLIAAVLGVGYAFAATFIAFRFPQDCDIACFFIPIFALTFGIVGNLAALLVAGAFFRLSIQRTILVLLLLNVLVLGAQLAVTYAQTKDQLPAFRKVRQEQKVFVKAQTVEDCAKLTESYHRPSCLIGKVRSEDDYRRCSANPAFDPNECRVAYAETVGDLTLCNGISTIDDHENIRSCIYDLVWGGSLAQKIPNEKAAVQCHSVEDLMERGYCSLFVILQFNERNLNSSYSYVSALCSDIPRGLPSNSVDYDNSILNKFCGPGHETQPQI